MWEISEYLPSLFPNFSTEFPKAGIEKRIKQRLNEFLLPMRILPFDENAARCYGDIRCQLEKQGQIIGPLDLLIAAHAMSEQLIIVTNNDKEFRRIQNLTVENWSENVS